MSTLMRARTSLTGLFRELTSDTRTFIRQEIQLAKTELAEKVSLFGRNAAVLAMGGFIAYAGLIIFLMGLGWLLAWAFEVAGLQPVLAGFIGLAASGLLTIVIGGVLLFKGLRTLSNESLAPERTVQTLRELRGTETLATAPVEPPEPEKKPSSAELQQRVEATENRMGETLEELGRRFSPQHINHQVKEKIRANPYRTGLIAMGAGIFSGFLLRRKFRHA